MSKRLSSLAKRVFITLLGISLLTWGVSTVLLGVVGERATAVIKQVRREAGERADAQGGRYTYVVSYRFRLPDGRSMDGSTKKISNGAYVRHPNTVTTVRYLKVFPALNALESETEFSLGQLVLVAIGAWLIWLVNGPCRNRRRARPLI